MKLMTYCIMIYKMHDLNAVNDCFAINYITLNISKSQHVSFSYRIPSINNFTLKLEEIVLDKMNADPCCENKYT